MDSSRFEHLDLGQEIAKPEVAESPVVAPRANPAVPPFPPGFLDPLKEYAADRVMRQMWDEQRALVQAQMRREAAERELKMRERLLQQQDSRPNPLADGWSWGQLKPPPGIRAYEYGDYSGLKAFVAGAAVI
jgi:hypothetical protein